MKRTLPRKHIFLFLFLISFWALVVLSHQSVYATEETSTPTGSTLSITTPTQWGVDADLMKEDATYKQMTDIYIIEIPINPDISYSTNNELIRSLYYHYVFKLGFNEPIANFVITPDQNVYQLTREPDSQVAHTNVSGVLVIGLLTTEDTPFSSYSTVLTQLLATSCSNYRISPTRIAASDYSLTASTTPSIAFTATASIDLQSLIDTIKTTLPGLITPTTPSATFTSEEFTLQLDPGTTGTIDIGVTNNGTSPLYGDASSTTFLKSSTTQKRSLFYSSDWASLLSGGALVEERLGPLESGIMRLTVTAPLQSGEHSEAFSLIGTGGTPLSTQTTTITITTTAIGQKVLQIKDTGAGYLNVRSKASGAASIIDTVAIRDIYFYDQVDNGYYHILNGTTPGWVSSRYIEVLE